jgi:hypothetical protein
MDFELSNPRLLIRCLYQMRIAPAERFTFQLPIVCFESVVSHNFAYVPNRSLFDVALGVKLVDSPLTPLCLSLHYIGMRLPSPPFPFHGRSFPFRDRAFPSYNRAFLLHRRSVLLSCWFLPLLGPFLSFRVRSNGLLTLQSHCFFRFSQVCVNAPSTTTDSPFQFLKSCFALIVGTYSLWNMYARVHLSQVVGYA